MSKYKQLSEEDRDRIMSDNEQQDLSKYISIAFLTLLLPRYDTMVYFKV